MLNLRLSNIPRETLSGIIASRSTAVRERRESVFSTPEITELP
jgi:hypothetical protein